ncbi:MAG: hypothetical protein ACXVA9_13010 [Bdellovibrionales bacterium]
MKSQNWIIALSLIIIGILPFQNCARMGSAKSASSDASSSSPAGSDGSGNPTSNIPALLQPNACNLLQLQAATVPVKVVFIVDESGSNAGDGGTYIGTDPGKVHRLASIQQFYANFGMKPNFSWGFLTFQGTTATSIFTANGIPAFTTDTNIMTQAFAFFSATPDYGQTPYIAAMDKAIQLISSDTPNAATKYVVVFLSDGVPTDLPPSTAAADLSTKVHNLLNSFPGQITFNTVYYGPNDAQAHALLMQASIAGNGQFLDLNTNSAVSSFMISSVVTVPGALCGP